MQDIKINEYPIYEYSFSDNKLKIKLIKNKTFSSYDFVNDISNKIDRLSINEIYISNIYSVSLLNSLLRILIYLPRNINITLDLSYGIENDSKLVTYDLPTNIKIKTIYSYNKNIESEIMNILHNQDENSKMKIFKTLDDKSRKGFILEEKIIYDFYNKMINIYPTFMTLTKEEQFDLIYTFIQLNYRDTYSDYDDTYDSDVINVYKNRKGNCVGISRLLKLVTNNSLLNIDCYTVTGTLKQGSKSSIEWNELILDNNVYEYDICTGIRKGLQKDLTNRRINQRDSHVTSILNKKESKVKEYILKPILDIDNI